MGIRGALFTSLAEQFTKAALAGTVPRCDAKYVEQSWVGEDGVGK